MTYDLVVIGAGIQGAGVAQAAAAAGHSVLVLEQYGVAAGTSSKSTKLIHGGLRYLETAQFGLVRESLRERSLLLKLAPELVKMQPLHIPVYNSSSRSAFTIGTGLWLYKLLAGFKRESRFSRLPRSAWAELEGLRTDGLHQVFRYFEAQTNDAQLTEAVLASARSLGAEVRIPARFLAAECNPDNCQIDYQYEGKRETVEAKVLVNCSGPWVEQVLTQISPRQIGPTIELVQGSHLLLPPLIKQRFYLEAPSDRRAIFALPWEGQLLLGTTERLHKGAPEQAQCHPSERRYLLDSFRHYFPDLELPEEERIESFAGLRVLPRTGQSAFKRTREVLFHTDNPDRPRVLSLMGGKLTTYRATALQALTRLRRSLPERQRRADTAELPLKPQS